MADFDKVSLEWANGCHNAPKRHNYPMMLHAHQAKRRVNGVKQKATCKALLDHTHNVVMNDFDDLTSINPDTLTDNELRVVMDNAKLIKSWLDAVESHIFDKAKQWSSV